MAAGRVSAPDRATIIMWPRALTAMVMGTVCCLVLAASAANGEMLSLPVAQVGNHFAVDLAIGTPPQTVRRVVLDTGSSDLVVLQSAYDPNKSSTAGLLSKETEVPSVHTLRVDNKNVRFTGTMVWADNTFFAEAPSSGPRTRSTLMVAESLAVTDVPPLIHDLVATNVSGYFGLSYPGFSRIANSTFFGLMMNWIATRPHTKLYVGLDMQRGAATNGSMQIGGLLPAYEPRMQWSEAAPEAAPPSYRVPVFHMTMCGVDLFGNYTSSWNVLMDTGATCLSMPREFFDAVMAWLPSDCDNPVNGRCRVGKAGATVDISQLPHLSFRLSEAGDPVIIPVSALVVGDGDDRSFCIVQSEKSVYLALATSNLRGSDISFGTLPIAAMYAAVDLSSTRLGFATKVALGAASPTEYCVANLPCKGSQTFYAPTNTCLPPTCNEYFFQITDADSQTCITSPTYKVLGIMLIVAFSGMEILQFYFKRTLATKAAQAASGRTRPPRPISRWASLKFPLTRQRLQPRNGWTRSED